MEITEEVQFGGLCIVVIRQIVALKSPVQFWETTPYTLMVELVDIPALEADA